MPNQFEQVAAQALIPWCNRALAGALTAKGIDTTVVAVMCSRPREWQQGAALEQARRQLQTSDGLIVFSPRAAECLLQLVHQHSLRVPAKTTLYAMGASTGKALRLDSALAKQVWSPEGNRGGGSAELIAQSANNRLGGLGALRAPLLVGGHGMRPLLRLWFASHGLHPEEMLLYRRVPTDFTPQLHKQLAQALHSCRAVLASSVTVLRLLVQRAAAMGLPYQHLAVVAGSDRIAAAAGALKFGKIKISDAANHELMAEDTLALLAKTDPRRL